MNNKTMVTKLIDIILDESIILIKNDASISGFSKGMMMNSIKGMKLPLQGYVYKMSNDDIDKLMIKITNVINHE